MADAAEPEGGARAPRRPRVDRELPPMLARVRRCYMPASAGESAALGAQERAWGLMPVARYGEVLERTVERDYRSRFAEHGIDVMAVWRAASAPRRDRPEGAGMPG